MSDENNKASKPSVTINMRKEGDVYVPDTVEVRGGNYYAFMAAGARLPTLDAIKRAYHVSEAQARGGKWEPIDLRPRFSVELGVNETGIRVPEGQDPNAYEMREGRKVYRREVVNGGKVEVVYVPESGWTAPDDSGNFFRYEKILGRRVPTNTVSDPREFGVRLPEKGDE